MVLQSRRGMNHLHSTKRIYRTFKNSIMMNYGENYVTSLLKNEGNFKSLYIPHTLTVFFTPESTRDINTKCFFLFHNDKPELTTDVRRLPNVERISRESRCQDKKSRARLFIRQHCQGLCRKNTTS